MNYWLKMGLIAVLSLLMSACGYHLHGSIALPESLKNLYVFGASAPLQKEIQQTVRASNGKIASSPNEAGVVIKILKEDMRNRSLSIGSSGKSSEIEITYHLRFQIYDQKENPLLEEQVVELNREYFNDQTAILAKETEEAQIRKEMYKQVARMLFSRAQVAVENKKN